MASVVCFRNDDCCEGGDGEPWKRLLIVHCPEGKGEIVNRTDSKIKLILGEITQTGIWLIDNVWTHCELEIPVVVCSLLHWSDERMKVCSSALKKWISAFSEAGAMHTGIATLHFVRVFFFFLPPAYRIWECEATDAEYSNDKASADLLMGSTFWCSSCPLIFLYVLYCKAGAGWSLRWVENTLQNPLLKISSSRVYHNKVLSAKTMLLVLCFYVFELWHNFSNYIQQFAMSDVDLILENGVSLFSFFSLFKLSTIQ